MTNLQQQLETIKSKYQKRYLQNVINAWKEAGKEMTEEDFRKILKVIQELGK
jgi:hypothetical protein